MKLERRAKGSGVEGIAGSWREDLGEINSSKLSSPVTDIKRVSGPKVWEVFGE
jgi:hypothetical protein